MNLTFDEAIENHRKMWNWVADETEKRQRIVEKRDYFKENEITEDVFERCFCCEYGGQRAKRYEGTAKCYYCPINWLYDDCEDEKSYYMLWYHCEDWRKTANYARKIANLPVREEAREL